MLDRGRIAKRLLDLERYSSRLEKIAPASFEKYMEAGHELKAAVERYLQLISDIELDISLLVYKGMELSLAGDETSLLERLQGVLGKKVIEEVRPRRTLRNKLVHAYSDESYDEDAFAQAHDLRDIVEFEKAVKRQLGKKRA
jgi:uncharacterized protein YutE (UPF0331/DUF86 family)